MLFSVKSYLTYLLKGRSKFYIHSPFVFTFINEVLNDNRQFYSFGDINTVRNNLLQNNTVIPIEDLGAGSKIASATTRKISSIAKTASIPEKYGQLLSRIVNHFQCVSILEL